MTSTPEEDYTAAAALATEHAGELAPDDPGRLFGAALAALFTDLNEKALMYGALPPTVRRLGLEAARAYLAVHRGDDEREKAFAALFEAGDPLTRALAIMTVNEGNSLPRTSPHLLSSAFVDLFSLVTGTDVEVDPALYESLRRLAAAVVAISADEDPEVDLDISEISSFTDGTIASARVAPGRALLGDFADLGATLLLGPAGDDLKQGVEYLAAAGVELPGYRFLMRNGPIDPDVFDVIDERDGQRVAIITEQPSKHGEHAEWNVSMIAPGAAKSSSTISFERAIEHLRTFLDECAAANNR